MEPLKPITKHTTYSKNEKDRCPCCNSVNIFTWVATNGKKKINMVTCDSCKFECTSNYKYNRYHNDYLTYF